MPTLFRLFVTYSTRCVMWIKVLRHVPFRSMCTNNSTYVFDWASFWGLLKFTSDCFIFDCDLTQVSTSLIILTCLIVSIGPTCFIILFRPCFLLKMYHDFFFSKLWLYTFIIPHYVHVAFGFIFFLYIILQWVECLLFLVLFMSSTVWWDYFLRDYYICCSFTMVLHGYVEQ